MQSPQASTLADRNCWVVDRDAPFFVGVVKYRRCLQHRQIALWPGGCWLGRGFGRRWLYRQMRGRLSRTRLLRDRRVQPHFALAAIAAAPALLTEVIVASVLGASRADARGFFSANAALKRHETATSFLGPARSGSPGSAALPDPSPYILSPARPPG